MKVLLKAENIYKQYQTASGDVPALNGVSAEFSRGSFYAITGRSGSGKSTLLHILSGLDCPSKGHVYYNDKDLTSYTDEKMSAFRRRFIGFVFQQYNLLEEYTVLKNITVPLLLDGKKPDGKFLEEITSLLGIKEKLKKYPGELSGGEQQRVAIARSLLAKPHVIFADEPTGNLDKSTGEETLELLQRCAARYGQTLVIVTHDPSIAEMADEMICLEDGRIIERRQKQA